MKRRTRSLDWDQSFEVIVLAICMICEECSKQGSRVKRDGSWYHSYEQKGIGPDGAVSTSQHFSPCKASALHLKLEDFDTEIS